MGEDGLLHGVDAGAGEGVFHRVDEVNVEGAVLAVVVRHWQSIECQLLLSRQLTKAGEGG